jgi:hypothetical protein
MAVRVYMLSREAIEAFAKLYTSGGSKSGDVKPKKRNK